MTLAHGWFPPVTPGTALVTVGGAIANDVHGKNHHRAGSFGHHLLSFELLRSDGETLRCAPDQHADWFAATIGGLGLTGMISTARLQMRRVPANGSAATASALATCRNSLRLAAQSDAAYEYTVAWLDCAASGSRLGRGVFMRGNHLQHERPRAARAFVAIAADSAGLAGNRPFGASCSMNSISIGRLRSKRRRYGTTNRSCFRSTACSTGIDCMVRAASSNISACCLQPQLPRLCRRCCGSLRARGRGRFWWYSSSSAISRHAGCCRFRARASLWRWISPTAASRHC